MVTGLGMPEAAAPMGSNGATMPEAEVASPLANDPPEHTIRPTLHHHDHQYQQKMPQAGMHGPGIAIAAGKVGGMLHESKSVDVFEFSCSFPVVLATMSYVSCVPSFSYASQACSLPH